MRKIFLCWIPQFFCVVLWDTVHHIRFCCGVGYNGKKLLRCGIQRETFVTILRFFLRCTPQRKKTSSVVSHNGGKPSPLYPTMEKNSSVVFYNGKKLLQLYPRRVTLMKQNGGNKSHGIIPLSVKKHKIY
jgi:hypothetical protein